MTSHVLQSSLNNAVPVTTPLIKFNNSTSNERSTKELRRCAECTWEEARRAFSWRSDEEEDERLLPADSTKHQTGPTEHVQNSTIGEQKQQRVRVNKNTACASQWSCWGEELLQIEISQSEIRETNLMYTTTRYRFLKVRSDNHNGVKQA